MNSCSSCLFPYIPASGLCEGNCSLIDYCSNCIVVDWQVVCLNCSLDRILSSNQCIPICGDGMMIDNEECDDQNLVDGDGCSSSCKV